MNTNEYYFLLFLHFLWGLWGYTVMRRADISMERIRDLESRLGWMKALDEEEGENQ